MTLKPILDLANSVGVTSFAQLEALLYLEAEPTILSNVAGHIGISSAGMTGLADKLETLSLISRTSYRTDRRKLYLDLTESGVDFVNKLKQLHDDAFLSST
jgi:MarR family 2-MHQ and catechol resistance regulon transcriptional repressor